MIRSIIIATVFFASVSAVSAQTLTGKIGPIIGKKTEVVLADAPKKLKRIPKGVKVFLAERDMECRWKTAPSKDGGGTYCDKFHGQYTQLYPSGKKIGVSLPQGWLVVIKTGKNRGKVEGLY